MRMSLAGWTNPLSSPLRAPRAEPRMIEGHRLEVVSEKVTGLHLDEVDELSSSTMSHLFRRQTPT